MCTSLANVEFLTTTGWYRTTKGTATSGTDMDVTDWEANATNLRSYSDYYWKRG